MEVSTVWAKWEDNARKYPDRDAIIFWKAGEEPLRWKFGEIVKKANEYSCLLKKNGIKKDEVCAIIIRHNFQFYPLYMGIVGAGAIPAVLAYPNPRLHPDKFRDGIRGMSQRSGLDWIFTERELEPILAPLLVNSTIKGVHYPLEWNADGSEKEFFEEVQNTRVERLNSDPVLLQHSSGTTGLQKPVLLSNGAILRHVEYYGNSIALCENDKIVSWLPLYHDMGLIAAFHIPLSYGIPSVQIDPFEWVLAPSLLIEAASKEQATISWLPNFAYNLMADKIPDDEIEGFSLGSLRMLINCSEPVRAESHKRFYERFRNYGFMETSLSACYAMAETTYGVTQTEPGKIPRVIFADREQLSKGIVKIVDDPSIARSCVSSGKVIEGCKVKIVDENRQETEEGVIGEIAIASVSMFDGYRNYPEKTAEVLQDGWYYSGDFGFLYEGECYVIGRKKDIIIVAGKNIYPEDIEDTVSKVPGVIPGRVIAFGNYDAELGTETIVVVAETALESLEDKRKLRLEILKAGVANDQNFNYIYLVPPRWLIKSSAGKPSRKANKERILSNSEFLVE